MKSALARRRPSPSMVVALVALFISLGGVGYAAVAVPPNSVGTAQLRNSAVTNHKIANGAVGNRKLKAGAVGRRKIQTGAVGLAQIDTGAVQARITGSCPAATAITSVDSTGAVGCASILPEAFGSDLGAPVTLTTGLQSQVAAKALAGGTPFFVLADPTVTVTGGTAGQSVEVDCTLGVSTDRTTRRRSLVVAVASPPATVQGSIPIVLAAQGGTSPVATVSCTIAGSGAGATVTAASAINAIAVASVS